MVQSARIRVVDKIRYLALGDSYTIGTGATDESRNFPSQLARNLEAATGLQVELLNPAVNGYTSKDLVLEELHLVDTFNPDLATILIGANDVVQGFDEASYRVRIKKIYDVLEARRLPAGRVVAISMPDFSLAPTATAYGTRETLRARIDAFNRVAKDEASKHAFDFVDISDLSRFGIGRNDWLSSDGLHPADQQYRAWAEYIWKQVAERWGAFRIKT
jgi:lysophospholipase L1-like esterase